MIIRRKRRKLRNKAESLIAEGHGREAAFCMAATALLRSRDRKKWDLGEPTTTWAAITEEFLHAGIGVPILTDGAVTTLVVPPLRPGYHIFGS